MRPRGPAAAVAAALACLASAACGGDQDAPEEAAFPPTTAAAAGDVLVAEADDPAGDVDDPAVDLRRARLEHRGTTLEVRIVLARPLSARPRPARALQVGAYLLRDPDDAEPYAARVVVAGRGAPTYRWGPWLAPGAAASGSSAGAEFRIVVRDVPPARFRYVQFFAESDVATDVAPEDTADAAGVVAIDPSGP